MPALYVSLGALRQPECVEGLRRFYHGNRRRCDALVAVVAVLGEDPVDIDILIDDAIRRQGVVPRVDSQPRTSNPHYTAPLSAADFSQIYFSYRRRLGSNAQTEPLAKASAAKAIAIRGQSTAVPRELPPPVAGSAGNGVEVGSAASSQLTPPSSICTSCAGMLGPLLNTTTVRASGLFPTLSHCMVIDASTVSLANPAALAPVTRNLPAPKSGSHTPPFLGRHSTTEMTSASYVISIIHSPTGSAMSVMLSSTDPSSPTSITREPT